MIETGQIRRRPGYCKFIVAEKVMTDWRPFIWGWYILLDNGTRTFVGQDWLEQTELL